MTRAPRDLRTTRAKAVQEPSSSKMVDGSGTGSVMLTVKFGEKTAVLAGNPIWPTVKGTVTFQSPGMTSGSGTRARRDGNGPVDRRRRARIALPPRAPCPRAILKMAAYNTPRFVVRCVKF